MEVREVNEDLEENLTEETKKILTKTAYMKQNTLNSMIVGKGQIIAGIEFFEDYLKNYNPYFVDNREYNNIEAGIDKKLSSNNGYLIMYSSYFMYGISNCIMMLAIHSELNKNKTMTKVKEINNNNSI